MKDYHQYDLEKITDLWLAFEPLVSAPATEREYERMVSFLDYLTDIVGNNETHPLASLMDVVGVLIESYENEHHPFSEGDPASALRYLMEVNELSPTDLPEIGERELSDILAGKSALTVARIQALSKRFNVSPATFC